MAGYFQGYPRHSWVILSQILFAKGCTGVIRFIYFKFTMKLFCYKGLITFYCIDILVAVMLNWQGRDWPYRFGAWLIIRHYPSYRFILLSTGEISEFLGIHQSTVGLYINRYNSYGIDSLLFDRTRKPGKEPISQEIKNEIYRLVCNEKPNGETHWSCRTIAKKSRLWACFSKYNT